MWMEANKLKQFYSGRIGKITQRIIEKKLQILVPKTGNQRILGLGYITPYTKTLFEATDRILTVMPPHQDMLHLPEMGSSLGVYAHEYELPFSDLSIDTVILIHALEWTNFVQPMLREVWRVLADSGKLVVVVPNRHGLWSQFEGTPFGQGRPYTRRQLFEVLQDNMFSPLKIKHALFVPPIDLRIITSASHVLEAVGSRFFPSIGGIVIADAVKKIYSATPVLETATKRKYAAIVERKGTHTL